MLRPEALRDETRIGQLVEAPLLEADRERTQRLARLRGGERGEHGRVDSAGEEHTDRHVRDQVRSDRVA